MAGAVMVPTVIRKLRAYGAVDMMERNSPAVQKKE